MPREHRRHRVADRPEILGGIRHPRRKPLFHRDNPAISLGDVLAGLPPALSRAGLDVRVVTGRSWPRRRLSTAPW